MSSTKGRRKPTKQVQYSRRAEARRHLSFDPLVKKIRERAEAIPDGRSRRCEFSVADAIMSALAMFSLKDPSLLAFEERRNDENIKTLFWVQQVPSDTHMRELLDPVPPDLFRPMFNDVLRAMQRGKALQQFIFHDGCYLLSLDGTQYFRSQNVHCSSCLVSKDSSTGKLTYSHQVLAASIVHPDKRTVIPLAPEPIINQDGTNKNDCERNASKRLLVKFRREHPHLPVIVVADGLSSNAPHIRLLKDLKMHFLLVAKPSDHQYLFQEVTKAMDENRYTIISWHPEDQPDVLCEVGFAHDLPLNQANPDVRVNFLCYTEYGPEGQRLQITWVTDLELTTDNARHLVRGGRARWKIENETFNTLKNQGYHFERNFGHGKKNLSVVFAMLMMLAFLIDQTQESCCGQFQAVLRKAGSRRHLWDCLRSHFRHFRFGSMWHLYEVMLHDRAKELPAPGSSLHLSGVSRAPPNSCSMSL
jgi:hypothetical protein